MAIPNLFNNNKDYQQMCLRAFEVKQQIKTLQKEYSELTHKIAEIECDFYNHKI